MKRTKLKDSIAYHVFTIYIILAATPCLAWQECNDAITPSAPNSRYQNNNDGTVTDLPTGLMWQQCPVGRTGTDCSMGTDSLYTWAGALQYVDSVNASEGFASHNDWRLPNLYELESLLENACHSPSINVTFFPNTSHTSYWSSSPTYSYQHYAWYVNFAFGEMFNQDRDNKASIRLVRTP